MGIKICSSVIFILLLTVFGCASSDNDSNQIRRFFKSYKPKI